MGTESLNNRKTGFIYSPVKMILLVVASFFMFGLKWIPVAGLSASGVQVLGILIGYM